MKRKRIGNYRRGRKPLDDRHFLAIALLSEIGRWRMTHEEIARSLSISRRTLARWRKRPDFDKALAAEISRKCRAYLRASRIRRRVSISHYSDSDIERILSVSGFL